MHHVGRIAERPQHAGVYAGHSTGFARVPLVGQADGSRHQEVCANELEPNGAVDLHAHAYEQGVYVLAGALSIDFPSGAETVGADGFCFIDLGVSHSLANAGPEPVRWLEVSAPQPGGQLDDTVFLARHLTPATVEVPHRTGAFASSQLPPPSDTIGLAGFGAANVGGASLRMLIERDFGASQFNLFVVEYAPAGAIKEHDHAFEEAFIIVSGSLEATLDGVTYTLSPGQYCWSGVGSMHAMANHADVPARWIETQAPQPPPRHQARFIADWERATAAG
jgi:mannose-6-phosphate isomerase-like protein (cupin superfamily)